MTESAEFDTKAEAEGRPPSPKKVHKRWTTELRMAGKSEEDWRKEAQDILDLYRGKEAKKNSYNILWANTEITRPALYNSAPHADVRRRFRDADPLGKAMSEVMKRALEYTIDVYDYDSVFKLAVLDMLLPGRGVMRLRYKPTIDGEAVTWECVMPELVQWDDYRHGPGKTWPEVRWHAFRHKLTREELVEQFGEDIGNAIELDAESEDDEIQKLKDDDELKGAFKTADVWEIWDNDARQCIFIAPSFTERPCKTVDDPLGIDEFAPMPNPLLALEDASSLLPTPIYRLYKEQAEELNRLSGRINRIIQAVKFRGIYDATITEMAELVNATDNELIPGTGIAQLIERGGLEKAIWTWPVNTIAQVLQYLYDARERTKAVIYELTGISDVVRGSTKASETLGAQQLKSQYAGVRLQKMQSSIQKFIRDAINIAGGIIAEKFQQETLMKMTGLPYPTQEQVQQQFQQQMMQWQQQTQKAQMQHQQQAQQAMMQGQQPPPPPQLPPQPQPPQVITWEQIIEALRDNPTRSYKIDIETDSTIQATIESDMEGLGQVGQAVNMVAGSMFPLVEKGFMPFEAFKELIGAITRRARLGNAVEDALDKMQAPQGQQMDPKEMQKQQAEMQKKEQELQQRELQLQAKEGQLQVKEQVNTVKEQASAKQSEFAATSQQLANDAAMQKIEKLVSQVEIKLQAAEAQAAAEGDQKKVAEVQQSQAALTQTLETIAQALMATKQIALQKDAMGRTTGAVSQPVVTAQ